MNLDQINKHFENEAFKYDGLIPKLIPKYQEQNQMLLDLIPLERSSNLQVLDLGCGTGILSFLVLSEFPNARVVALDMAENMLRVCSSTLSNFSDRLTLRQANFGSDDFGQGFDLLISGLAIHHLDHPGKRKLYKRIFQSLNPSGVFLNREVILGASSSISNLYHKLWRQFIKGNGEDDEKWFNTYLEEDNPATLEDQLGWLKEAGFKDVGCHWQYLNFAIFGGRKGK